MKLKQPPKWANLGSDIPRSGWEFVSVGDYGAFKEEFNGPHVKGGGVLCDMCATRTRYGHRIRHGGFNFVVGKRCGSIATGENLFDIEKQFVRDEVERLRQKGYQEAREAAESHRRANIQAEFDGIAATWMEQFRTTQSGSRCIKLRTASVTIDATIYRRGDWRFILNLPGGSGKPVHSRHYYQTWEAAATDCYRRFIEYVRKYPEAFGIPA